MALDFSWAVRDLTLSKPLKNSDGSIIFFANTQTTYKFIFAFSKIEAELYMPHKSTILLRVRNEDIARYLIDYNKGNFEKLSKKGIQGLPLEWVFLTHDSRSYARVALDKKNDIWKYIGINGFMVSSFWENPEWTPKNKVFVLYDTEGNIYKSTQLLSRAEHEKFDHFCTIQTYDKRWPNFPHDPVKRDEMFLYAKVSVLK